MLTRFAAEYRIFIIEEPVYDTNSPFLHISSDSDSVTIIVPHLETKDQDDQQLLQQQSLLKDWADKSNISTFIAWFYNPLAIPLLEAFPAPELVIYDCMDELSAFKGASHEMKNYESSLLNISDLVFTGGHSLFESKKHLHPNIYPFPSSIDKSHFGKARNYSATPDDQQKIPHPRIGFFGVIDERFDIELIQQLSRLKPKWQFILVGPVVKIDPDTLPKAGNIHYTGARTYEQLPEYLSGWDVALIPFALNESTQFISPTKTPEYLSGAVPVVSSPIADLVNPYGHLELVYIANGPDEFIKGIEWGFKRGTEPEWLARVDEYLGGLSWDHTYEEMSSHIKNHLERKQSATTLQNTQEYV